ncbi:acyl-CoA N-acyltransferase [Thozetella sp. PMI_491]|nr:acyl-CoA N-acyltransferase [Thozetella sp. PMI_491]
MEQISEAFLTAYASERLVYRAVGNTEEDKEWLYKFLDYDPLAAGLGQHSMFKQNDKKSSNATFDRILAAKMLLNTFICLPAEETPEEVAELEELGPGERAARRREKATPIGHLILSPQREGQTHVRFTRIGLGIAEKYQNKGYGAEAINWATDWAFNVANVHKVEIGTASYNERAAHLYEKLGFKPEGRIRHVAFMNRQWYDVLEFGMLEHEWEELRGLKKPVPTRTK